MRQFRWFSKHCDTLYAVFAKNHIYEPKEPLLLLLENLHIREESRKTFASERRFCVQVNGCDLNELEPFISWKTILHHM